mmetsp:Transcript_31434/g.57022  ORF Transcript_31434/g.57022 Transcript_31434/m.57022 type:complete len:804 (-) Transcript_31434:1-2412(-)
MSMSSPHRTAQGNSKPASPGGHAEAFLSSSERASTASGRWSRGQSTRLGTAQSMSLSSLPGPATVLSGTSPSASSTSWRTRRVNQVGLGMSERDVQEHEEEAQGRQILRSVGSPSARSLRVLRSSTPLPLPGSPELQQSPKASTLGGHGMKHLKKSASGIDSSNEVEQNIRKHFDACKEETRAIEEMLAARAQKSMQVEEAGAVDEEAERRLQLEEQRRKMFQARQKARDPYRRVMLRLEDARAEEEDLREHAGKDQGAPAERPVGKKGPVPMMNVEVPSPNGKEMCAIVDVKKLQAKSATLGRGMSVKDMLHMRKSEDNHRLPALRKSKSASFTMTPQERHHRMRQTRSRSKVSKMAFFMHTVHHAHGIIGNDDLDRLRMDTYECMEASCSIDDEQGFLKAWFTELGVTDEIKHFLRMNSITEAQRRLRLLRGCLRIFCICSAHIRRANRAAALLKSFFAQAPFGSWRIKTVEERKRVADFCRDFMARREKHRQDMCRQWQEVEDRFLSTWAEKVIADDANMQGLAGGVGVGAKAPVQTTPEEESDGDDEFNFLSFMPPPSPKAIAKPWDDADDDDDLDEIARKVADDWRQLRIPADLQNKLLSQYYNARLCKWSSLRKKAATSRKARKSVVADRPFWHLLESEILELIAIAARHLHAEHPFLVHPANLLPNSVLSAYDEEKEQRARKTMLFVSLQKLHSSDSRRSLPSKSDKKQDAASESDESKKTLSTKSASALRTASESLGPSSDLGSELPTSPDLDEVMDRFTPRLCWQDFMGDVAQRKGSKESEDGNEPQPPETLGW